MSRLPRSTPLGATIVAAIVVAASLGWALDHAAFRVAAVAGLVAVGVAWWSARRVPDLDIEREIAPVRVERGRPAQSLVMVVNRRVRRAPATTITHTIGDERIDRAVPALAEGRSVIVAVDLPTQHRGAVTVEAPRLGRTDAAGLWRTDAAVGATATLLVQPREHPIDPRPGGRFRHLDGLANDRGRDGSITFQSLREYVPGDDVRRVHWRSTARTGTLMVREHVDASLPSTIVVLDTRREAYGHADDFESAVDVAASVVAASRRAGYLVRLLAADGTVLDLRAGERGQDIADYLAAVQLGTDADLGLAAEAVRRSRQRDAIVVVTGRTDRTSIDLVTRMTRAFATPILVTIDPAGADGVHEPARWTGGLHLSGGDATEALRRWGVGAAPDVRPFRDQGAA
ncbi:MAG: DUF58 domain-containing protein [Actinomycetota bacterium]